MGKKGLLEKLGLVEDTNNEEGKGYFKEVDVESLSEEVKGLTSNYDSKVEIPEDLDTKDMISIEQVYEKFNLNDMEKSIFKIDEFSKVLPSTLPTESKRQSVIGILNASSIEVGELLEDAGKRVDALNSTIEVFTNESETIISDNDKEIKELEIKIDELKQINTNRRKLQEEEEKLISNEIDEINKIIDFISPSK